MPADTPAKPSAMDWNEALRVGLPEIDEQHALLFSIANRLLDHPEALGRDERVVDILTDLGKFLILHFQTEETMMRNLGVPDDEYQHHVSAHNRIIDEYAELNLAVTRGQHQTATDIFAQIRTWLHDHHHSHDVRLRALAPAGSAG